MTIHAIDSMGMGRTTRVPKSSLCYELDKARLHDLETCSIPVLFSQKCSHSEHVFKADTVTSVWNTEETGDIHRWSPIFSIKLKMVWGHNHFFTSSIQINLAFVCLVFGWLLCWTSLIFIRLIRFWLPNGLTSNMSVSKSIQNFRAIQNLNLNLDIFDNVT